MSYVKTNANGTFHFKDPEMSILHREDGPAIEHSDGTRIWHINGKLHRTDGPAVERENGTKEWYLNGNRHREDGPAIEWCNGDRQWYIEGKLHREDGPAVDHHIVDYQAWCNRGMYHRLDGPAIKSLGGDYWYINDVEYTQDEFPAAVARWLSRKEITRREIRNLIGDYRIVEWL